ncbi:MAG: NAD(P)-dependent oxidoreductase [Bacteroidia bacterium]|nr:NAD(P)-dependent oxidoreductase [Bacteroidia bacterium]
MIIGSGLLAGAFSRYAQSENVLIFASGVSNSMLRETPAFEREFDLVKECVQKPFLFVYFSTTSVLDPEQALSPYVKHKKRIEEYIRSHAGRFLILRLPILVGKTNNPHTLINFLYDAIRSGRHFVLQANACRHLASVEDIAEIGEVLIEDKSVHNHIINICFDNQTKVTEIVRLLEELMNKKGDYALADTGGCVSVDNSYIRTDARFKSYFGRTDLNRTILTKYISGR